MVVKTVGSCEELNMSEDRREREMKRKIQRVFWEKMEFLRVCSKHWKAF